MALKIPAHRLIFKPLRRYNHWGATTHEDRCIELDPRAGSKSGGGSVAQVYLHEIIHLTHRSWSETRVLREERRRWKKLTWKDKARLYKAMGKARIGDLDE